MNTTTREEEEVLDEEEDYEEGDEESEDVEDEEEDEETVGDRAGGLFAILSFNVVAWTFDALTTIIGNMQMKLINILVAGAQTGIGAVIELVAFTAIGVVSYFSETVRDLTLTTIAFVFGTQIVFSIIVFCIFIITATLAPRQFSLTDYVVASTVFLLECFPIVCGFTFWGTFGIYLRRKALGIGGKSRPSLRSVKWGRK